MFCTRTLFPLASAARMFSFGQIGEVAGPFRCRGYLRNHALRRAPHPSPLIGAEIEQLILFYWSADAAAELVAFESILRGREEVARIQGSIPEKLEDIAVDLV